MYHIRTIKRFTIGALYDKMVGERIKDCHLVKRDVGAYRDGEMSGGNKGQPFYLLLFLYFHCGDCRGCMRESYGESYDLFNNLPTFIPKWANFPYLVKYIIYKCYRYRAESETLRFPAYCHWMIIKWRHLWRPSRPAGPDASKTWIIRSHGIKKEQIMSLDYAEMCGVEPKWRTS